MTSSLANGSPMPQSREELTQLLVETFSPVDRAQLLLKLALRTFRSDYETAWEHLAEGMRLLQELDDRPGLLLAHCVMAELLSFRERFNDALQALELAADYLPQRNPSPMERGRIAGMRGKLLYQCGRHTEAVPFLVTALEAFKSVGHVPSAARVTSVLTAAYCSFWMYEEAMSLCLDALVLLEQDTTSLYHGALYIAMGNICYELNDYEEAINYCRQAHAYYSRIGDVHGTAIALLNIGTAYEQQKRLEEALAMYTEALPLARQGEPAMTASLLTNIGTVYELIDRFDEALEYELEALAIVNASEIAGRQYRVLRCLGRLYAKMERFDEALDHLQNGLHRSEQTEDVDSQHQFHGELAACYSMMGDAASALRHKLLAEELVGKAKKADALGKVMRLAAQHELKRLQRQQENAAARVADLEKENLRQAQELTAVTLHAAHKQEVLLRLKKITDASAIGNHAELVSSLREIINAEVSTGNDDGWQQFEHGFSGLHPEFIAGLTLRFPGITPAELKIAALLKIGLSTKEIADVLCISIHTANTHRRRLRRRLDLPESANLVSFLNSL